MEKRLEDVAEVLKGFPHRLKEEGKVPCLRPKDFNKSGEFVNNVELHIAVTEETKKFLLQDGDILLQCKGPVNRAIPFPDQLGEAVAIDIFTIIRPSAAIRQGDLIQFLNGDEGQKALKNLRKGDDIPAISHKDLKGLEVPVVPQPS